MRPRKEVYLALMRKTFALRRYFILHNATSVQAILRDYPGLKAASAVSSRLKYI